MAYLIEKDQIEKYSLVDMEDFPVEYTGQSLKALRVKEDETGVEFSDAAAGYEFWNLATITDRIKNGYLYTWFTATDARNIAASNAHVPTKAEWNTLMATLGGTTNAGYNMKVAGYPCWVSGGGGGMFGAFPNGLRYSWGAFDGLNALATWWTTSQDSIELGRRFYIEDLRGDLYQGGAEKKEGHGIRLIVTEPIEISGNSAFYVGNNGVRYECRLFGSQWWTLVNLVETLYRNGDPITLDPTDTWGDGIDEGKRCAYNNMESNAYFPNEAIINSTDTIEVIAGENIIVELVGNQLKITASLVSQINESVQILSGNYCEWNTLNGIHATITLSSNTIISLSNLRTGQSGNLTIINPTEIYILTFEGYVNEISPAIWKSDDQPIISGLMLKDCFSWYYDGISLFWNGTNGYKP